VTPLDALAKLKRSQGFASMRAHNDVAGYTSGDVNTQWIVCIVDAFEELEHDRTARNAIDPVTRLHNICDAMAEDRKVSPYSQAAWDAQDKAYRDKCAELTAAQSRLAALEAALVKDVVHQAALQASIQIALRRITEQSCSKCNYDEAEGGLIGHCADCCLRITTQAYRLAHLPESK